MNDIDDDFPTIRQAQTHSHDIRKVNIQPFVGRIGGNQLFTTTDTSVTASVPDAKRTPSWKELLDLRGFLEWSTWQNAIIEGVGTCLLVFMTGLVSAGVIPVASTNSLGPIIPVSLAALFQFIVLTLFIFTLGPVSGAHLNPLITMSTFFTKLTSLPRAILYISFQCIGAVIGSFILRSALGVPPEGLVLSPGCYIDPTLVTPVEAFALEFMGSFFLIFLAFGLGLDPRNANVFGGSLGPFLIGLASAMTLFAGGISRKGFLGMSTNPARCLGLMAASHRFTYHYIHWAADLAAAM
jgi:glycerol uptake facilitator-like aquaporin